MDFRALSCCKTHDFTAFYVTSPCSSFSCIFELSHFCRTILQNYNWYLFSSTKINKVSVPIILEEWDCMVWLPWKELSRVATLPYFRMLRPSKFRRSEFGGGCGEGRELLLDIKLFLLLHPRSWLAYIKSASINIFSTPFY